MKELEKFFLKQGLEVICKKSVTQYAIDGLVAFSVSGGKRIVINFPLFKDESKGRYRTPKVNKQREEFMKIVNGDERVDLTLPAPRAFFENEREAIISLIKWRAVYLAKKYSVFEEVNVNYSLNKAVVNEIILNYRENIPTEIEIMRDVFKNDEYVRKGLVLGKSDIVLDLGGNIGAFSIRQFKKVKKIIAYEPDEVNHLIFEKNIKENNAKNIILIKKAVVGNDDKIRNFYVGKVPYYYSFLVKNNRKRVAVKCENINEIIKKYHPTKMKVDIEGSEFEVLMSCSDFSSVNQIIFEYNFDMNGDLKSGFKNFEKLSVHLKKHKFDVSQLENYSRSKNWAEVFICNKK